MENLLKGIVIPDDDSEIKDACHTIRQRLDEHQRKFELLKQKFDIERSFAYAALTSLQKRCKHPGAKLGWDDWAGPYMSECRVCGKSE